MPPRPAKRPVKGGKGDTLSLEQQAAALAAARPQTPNDVQLIATQQIIQSNASNEMKWEDRLVCSKGQAQVTLNKVHRLSVLMQLCRHAVVEIDNQVEDYLAKINNWPIFLPAPSVTSAFNSQGPLVRGMEQLNTISAAAVSSSMYGAASGDGSTPSPVSGAPGRKGGAARGSQSAASGNEKRTRSAKSPPPAVDATEAMCSALKMQFSQDSIVHELLMALPSPVTQPAEFTAAVVELMQTGTSSLLPAGAFAGIVGAFVANGVPVPNTVPGAPTSESKGRASARGRRSLPGGSPTKGDGPSSSSSSPQALSMPPAQVAQLLTQAGLGKGVAVTEVPVIGPTGIVLPPATIASDPSFDAVLKMRKAQVAALSTYLRSCFKMPRMGSKEKPPGRPTTAADFKMELAVGSRIATPYTDVTSLTSAMTNAAQGAPPFTVPSAVDAIRNAAMATAASVEGFEWHHENNNQTAAPTNPGKEEKGSYKSGGGKGATEKAGSPSPSKRADKVAVAPLSPALSQFLASVDGKGAGKGGSKGAPVSSTPDPAAVDSAMQHLFMLTSDFRCGSVVDLDGSGAGLSSGAFGGLGDVLSGEFQSIPQSPPSRGGGTALGEAVSSSKPTKQEKRKQGSALPLPPKPPALPPVAADQGSDASVTFNGATDTMKSTASLLDSVLAAKDVQTLLAQSFHFFALPCPKGLDPLIMQQISSWRSQRLRLEACLRALEEEKAPLMNRVDVASEMHVLGSYSVWAAKRDLSVAKQAEHQLLKKRLQEERDFLATQNGSSSVGAVESSPSGKGGTKGGGAKR